jgi:apolipoprotein D and lipocalin family protein
VFTFNKGGFNGEAKRYNPKGFVVENTGNAVWGMRFIWPIKAEYRISYVDEQYQQTIIARSARDYVWLMARTPKISDEQYGSLVKRIQDMGYDSKNLVKIPQQ